ncbi:hypothetical protein AVEN_120660-1 [Araneus ventricosus]|uniref:C2H2-type domain-containing protein n=1 Tax=Araneus ventricosus TaxID=182803 RepID=A0A4Y2T6V4_ARAVE|nr:hypothetical protein AVEN_120660-1 [Araneus ventricosus]
MATAGFSCLHCSKWFRSKIGLGVHMQSQHREQYEATIKIPKTKTRWSSEEIALMAMSEATFLQQGRTLEINTYLLSQLPNRTREAIKGQRRQAKYKNLVREYMSSTSASSGPAVSDPSSSAPSVSADSSSNSNLTITSSLDISNDVPSTRPLTRRQRRLAEIKAKDPILVKPPDPLDPPGAGSSNSSVDDIEVHEISLSFLDPNLEVESEASSSVGLVDSSLDVIETIREVRSELDAASTSILELSSSEATRLDRTLPPEVAFSFDDVDSKLIDYLDLLFRSDRSSELSTELRDVWNDFRLRPCKDTLFIRTCLIFEVLLTDKSCTSKRPREARRPFQRVDLPRRVKRRI